MTALAGFQESILAADRLVSMYVELRASRGLGARGRLDAANQDLLWLPRSAVVAAMSALDSYVHEVLYDQIPTALSAPPVPDPLAEAMADMLPIKNRNGFANALPILTAPDTINQLAEQYKEKTLSFLSYQAPAKIVAGYALIGKPNIFEEASKLWPGPGTTAGDLKRQLANYAKRRNQIAHEGDREPSGTARPMQPEYARKCRDFVFNLVVRLDRVVYGP